MTRCIAGAGSGPDAQVGRSSHLAPGPQSKGPAARVSCSATIFAPSPGTRAGHYTMAQLTEQLRAHKGAWFRLAAVVTQANRWLGTRGGAVTMRQTRLRARFSLGDRSTVQLSRCPAVPSLEKGARRSPIGERSGIQACWRTCCTRRTAVRRASANRLRAMPSSKKGTVHSFSWPGCRNI
jgi:hypothetical protein